jgi:hypothetical protein
MNLIKKRLIASIDNETFFDEDGIFVNDNSSDDNIDCQFVYPFEYEGVELQAVLGAYADDGDAYVGYNIAVYKGDKFIAGNPNSMEFETDVNGFEVSEDCAMDYLEIVEDYVNNTIGDTIARRL